MKEKIEEKPLKDFIKYAKNSPKGVYQITVDGNIVEVTVMEDHENFYSQKMEKALKLAEKNGKIIKKQTKGEIDTVKALRSARNERGKAINVKV